MILIWKIGGAQTVRQRVDSGNEPSGRGKQVAATEKRYQLMAMTTRLCSFAFFSAHAVGRENKKKNGVSSKRWRCHAVVCSKTKVKKSDSCRNPIGLPLIFKTHTHTRILEESTKVSSKPIQRHLCASKHFINFSRVVFHPQASPRDFTFLFRFSDERGAKFVTRGRRQFEWSLSSPKASPVWMIS